MTVQEIRNLINKDLEKVFDILNEIFEDNNATYNDYCNEYMDKPSGFSKSDFRLRLKLFIQKERKCIEGFFNKSQIDTESETGSFAGKSNREYELLRKLNFTVPVKYFKDFSNSNESLLAFVIKGNGSGEKWLYHKLIWESFECYNCSKKPFIVDFGSSGINRTFEDLLIILGAALGIDKKGYEDKPTRKKQVIIKNKLLDIMKQESQILVFKEVFTFLGKDFENFYSILRNISDEIEHSKGVNKKCIVLLIEREKHHLPVHKDKFIFVSEMPYSHQAVDMLENELKIIDLGSVMPITIKCINEWLIHLSKNLRKELNEEKIKELISNCDNGHPDKVIAEICTQININFENQKNLWLTF